jgi:hypothetical protein
MIQEIKGRNGFICLRIGPSYRGLAWTLIENSFHKTRTEESSEYAILTFPGRPSHSLWTRWHSGRQSQRWILLSASSQLCETLYLCLEGSGLCIGTGEDCAPVRYLYIWVIHVCAKNLTIKLSQVQRHCTKNSLLIQIRLQEQLYSVGKPYQFHNTCVRNIRDILIIWCSFT